MPTCVEFWVWLGSGIVIVPLLVWLKTLPKVGEIVETNAWVIAPLLAAVLPQIAQKLTPYCAVIDPVAWVAIYAGLTYLVSQIVYHISKRVGAKVGVKV